MKLNYAQLEAHISKTLAPIYIISGDEILLKQEAINLIRKAAKQAGFHERTRLASEAGYDWDQLYSLLHSGSLLADKRLIELDFRDALPNKTATSILQDYAAHPVSDNIVLIDISKIDDKIARSAWYKALEKSAMVMAIWPIPREQLPAWIVQRAKRYKLQLNLEAANFLADYIEGNLVAAAQAIEKIYLLQPQQTIDSQLLATILIDESRYTVFDFIENLIAGNKTRSLHILTNLQLDEVEPILILWAITRELRMLADMAQQLRSGKSYDELWQQYRIFSRRQSVVRQFLQKFSAQDCWQQLTHALEIDRMLKGAAVGNAWNALQLFCLRLG